MIKTEYFCDGCGRKMEQSDITKTHEAVTSYLAEHPERVSIVNDIFCAKCAEKASACWDGKYEVWRDATDVALRRIENYKKQFWTKPSLKLASKGK